MSEKLRECPFCGKIDTLFVGTEGEIEKKEESENISDYSDYYAVCCNFRHGGCGTISGYRSTKEDAILAWNTRATDENPPLTLEELRQMEGQPVQVIYHSDLIYQAQGKPIKYKTGIVRLNYPITSVISDDVVVFESNRCLMINNYYGETWLAYRRKPEVQNEQN